MHTLHRFAKSRPRLLIAFALGAAAGVLLPPHWRMVTRLLGGWNVTIWSYLVLMGWLMPRASHARVRRMAEQEDNSAKVVLAIISILAVASIAAIVLELTGVHDLPFSRRVGHYIFTGATVFGSWCMVAVIFTFHYAHLFYRADPARRPLRFADDEQAPDYWDFLYFSFTIAVAAQTSDVSIMSRSARKTVLTQSFLSFVFNTAILGLSINIAAGIVGG
ncbi:DUF1345 domain-containing protein [Massilia sp. R2A-15]|uniref:DUF1345 domain-containing protein n=1 Tax=Massilia sp. R2A-15 TaxID=3064278 RepID=UPI002735A555|nr:DUF1345 domain-containing protein [Massilia sp. R2A-15]WLI91104.1 DUF1345 domain-containing protein [Massilia sp. R2A-15]